MKQHFFKKGKFFPFLNSGITSRSNVAIRNYILISFLLSTEGRALYEDFEGVERKQKELLFVLKIRLIEFLYELEMSVSNADCLPIHYFALSLQYGLPSIICPEEIDLVSLFRLKVVGDIEKELQYFKDLWETILDDFPGNVPNPLQSSKQGDFLRGLQNWSKICKAHQIDDSFLLPLFKAL